MEHEIPGGFIQVETDPEKVGRGGPSHLSVHPPLPGRVVDRPPEEGDEDDDNIE